MPFFVWLPNSGSENGGTQFGRIIIWKLYKCAVTYWMLAAFKPLACMLGVSVFETSSLMKSFDDASFGCLDVPWYNNDLAIAHQFSLNGIFYQSCY